MKMAVFWDVAPCNLVDIARSFIGVYLITLMIEAKVKQYLPEYTVQHPRRRSSSL
jgi:hypothetical protein